MRNTQNLLVFIQILRSSLAITGHRVGFSVDAAAVAGVCKFARLGSDFGPELRVLSLSFGGSSRARPKRSAES